MGLFDLDALIEKVIANLDLDGIAETIMENLTISGKDMYFVVRQLPDEEYYEFVGMSYSRKSAQSLRDQNPGSKILRFDMGKLATIVERMGASEQVS